MVPGASGAQPRGLTSARPAPSKAPTSFQEGKWASGGLTKVLRGLEERDLVVRSEHEADQRSRPARLTPKGRSLAEQGMADVLDADGALLARGLSPEEMTRLIALVRKMLVALEPAHDPKG
jgi:DNA-binding MarR family transcriptional regulator